MRAMLALAMLGMMSTPVAAQIDPAARGLAVQAKATATQAQTAATQAQTTATQAQTLAIGRDPFLWTDIGDSRVDADFINPAQTAFNMRSSMIWARQLTGQRFVIGSTFGKSGDRTDQFLPRVPLVLATLSGGVRILGCLNDIAQNYPTASTSGATCAANIISMAETFRLAGMKVIIELEVGSSTINASQVQQVHEANQRLIDYQETAIGVYLSDARSIVMNPTASTTTMSGRPGYFLDGVHGISRAEYYRAQGTLVPIFNTILPPRNVLIRSGTELPTNGRWQLALNPIFATTTGGTIETKAAIASLDGTTGVTLTSPNANPLPTMPVGATISGNGIPAGTTITAQPSGGGAGKYTISQSATTTASGVATTIAAIQGTVPSGWTWGTVGQALGTVSTQVDPDGVGNNAVVTCTWVQAGDGCRFYQTVGTSYWSIGDIVQAVSQVQVTGPSSCLAATRLDLFVNGTTSGTNASTELQDGYHATTAGSVGPDVPYTATLITRAYKVPTYDTKGYLAPYIYIEGSCAGTVTAVIKQVGVKRRLSAPAG